MTNLLQFTTIVPKSHQLQCTLQCLFDEHVLFIQVDLHISVCRQQHPKREQLFLCIQLYFCKLLFIQQHKQKSNRVRSGELRGFKQLWLGNHSEIDTCS